MADNVSNATGVFGSIDSGIQKIKDGFFSGGFIDKVVKIAKVTGLAALGMGGFALSKKLEMMDTVSSIKDFIDNIKDGKGAAGLINPSVQAEVKEPIKIPEKSQIDKVEPEGDKQAKADKRKAKADKTSVSSPTKIALDTATKMNQLTKRTQQIMSSYGLKSVKSISDAEISKGFMGDNNPESQSPTQVSTQEIAASYQFNGGNLERLMAANNELLGIISEEVKLLHTNQVSKIVASKSRAQLMEILADKDDKTAKKIEEENAKVETLTEVLLKNQFFAQNKTNENIKSKSSGQDVGGGLMDKTPQIGKIIGTITKLAIPLLIKKSYDILTEKSDQETKDKFNKDYNENQNLNKLANDGQLSVDGKQLELKENQGLIKADDPSLANRINFAIQKDADSLPKWVKALTFMGIPVEEAYRGVGEVINLFGNKLGQEVKDANGNVIAHAHVIDYSDYIPKYIEGSDVPIYYLKKTGKKNSRGGDAVELTKDGQQVRYLPDPSTGKWRQLDEGPNDGNKGYVRPRSGPTATSSNTRGAGKSILIDTNRNLVGFNGGNSSSSGLDKGVNYESGGNLDWSPSEAQSESTAISVPDMDQSAMTVGQSVVNAMKELDSKIVYSQTGSRNPYAGDHTSDCSSTVRHVMKNVAGIDPGYSTPAQVMNKEGVWVDRSTIDIHGNGEGKVPDESKLRPGDLLYFRPNNPARRDKSRPYQVGHVEMYIGNGQLMGQTGEAPGHKGPVTHPINKPWLVRGYIGAKRFIKNTGTIETGDQLDQTINQYMLDHDLGGSIQTGSQLDQQIQKYAASKGITTSPSTSTTSSPVSIPEVKSATNDMFGTKPQSTGKVGEGSVLAPTTNNVKEGDNVTVNNDNSSHSTTVYNYGSSSGNPDLKQGG